jgi:Ca2+-binding RTX toxin-like protein
MRTTTLTTTALLTLGLLVPTQAATAAGETCRGEAATIVGANGDPIVGTEGRDVVVTNGVMSAKTLGGDDLICITGQPLLAMVVEAGDGDDVVDASSGKLVQLTDLGTGRDTFFGSDGDDRVTSDLHDGAAPDVIEARGGTDTILLDGGPSDLTIDNAAGRATIAGQVRAMWSGLEEFRLDRSGTRALTFVGSDGAEAVFDSGTGDTLADVDLGKGRDSYHVDVAPLEGSRLRGGGGRDLVEVRSGGAGLELDLKRHRMIVEGTTPYYVSTPDLEDASLQAPEVRLKGDETANHLGYAACKAVVKGREGSDEVRWAYAGSFGFALDCPDSARIDGGPGHDDLEGTGGPDVLNGNDGKDLLRGRNGDDKLFGGRGRDRAEGGRGRDRCSAEREKSCER